LLFSNIIIAQDLNFQKLSGKIAFNIMSLIKKGKFEDARKILYEKNQDSINLVKNFKALQSLLIENGIPSRRSAKIVTQDDFKVSSDYLALSYPLNTYNSDSVKYSIEFLFRYDSNNKSSLLISIRPHRPLNYDDILKLMNEKKE
jgi:hypothetical protein